jgi:hypothetical protein
MVRQTGFLPASAPTDSPVVAMDLNTGGELWAKDIPYNSGDWTAWVAGVKNGKVFASRSGNGASVHAKMHALDAATGSTLWMSQDLIDAGPYDGVVFADDGDPVVASFRDIWRINADDGTTAWHATRTASVSGNCGGAIFGHSFYVVDAIFGGNVVRRFDLTTGAQTAEGPLMAGFTVQNTPFVGPEGTIYFSRTQNNAPFDNFYAFTDNGTSITEKWHVPARWTTSSEFTVGAGGSAYMIAPGDIVRRLDPSTGATLNDSAPIASEVNLSPRMASDPAGHVYVSSGTFSNGHFYCFDADLSPVWDVAVPNINIGAPCIGQGGVLVIAGVGTNVKAYKTAATCYADCNGDGTLNLSDFGCFQTKFATGDPYADCNGDGVRNLSDFGCFQTKFALGCP